MSKTFRTAITTSNADEKKKAKQFDEPEICRFCDGEGVVEDHASSMSELMKMCPICEGEGVVWKS